MKSASRPQGSRRRFHFKFPSKNPHLHIAKSYLSRIPINLLSSNANMTIAIITITGACDGLLIDVQVNLAAICSDCDQVRLIQAGENGWTGTACQCLSIGILIVHVEKEDVGAILADTEVIELG